MEHPNLTRPRIIVLEAAPYIKERQYWNPVLCRWQQNLSDDHVMTGDITHDFEVAWATVRRAEWIKRALVSVEYYNSH